MSIPVVKVPAFVAILMLVILATSLAHEHRIGLVNSNEFDLRIVSMVKVRMMPARPKCLCESKVIMFRSIASIRGNRRCRGRD